jgi:hypothetical protein
MIGVGPVPQLLLCFMIANAERDGTVEANPRLLAAMFGCPESDVSNAFTFLSSPDANSRTPDSEGRRIEQIGPFMWRLVNYVQFREMRSQEERRAYQASWINEKRRKCRQSTKSSGESTESTKDRGEKADTTSPGSERTGSREGHPEGKKKKPRSGAPSKLEPIIAAIEKTRPGFGQNCNHAALERLRQDYGTSGLQNAVAAVADWSVIDVPIAMLASECKRQRDRGRQGRSGDPERKRLEAFIS